MAKGRKKANGVTNLKPIEQYEHKDKERINNPPVGLVDAHTDNGGYKKQTYQYDPHLDPQLQWAGKAEHTSFDVPTVSLHVHERIDPRRIIETVRKEEKEVPVQMSLFETEKKPLREAIEFYKHKENWSNRLIAGDSLLVMNSLLEKEGMGEKVQMVFFDPPYGITYGSNFQPFVNKRDVKDGNDGDLTAEPEMLKAFRDTWELGIHSFLTYLRDRVTLASQLLNKTGSIFIQISDENLHFVRNILDEIFGPNNFMSIISFQTKIPLGTKHLANLNDYLVWYAKDKSQVKFSKIFKERELNESYGYIELENGTIKRFNYENDKELLQNKKNRIFRILDLVSSGQTETCIYDFEFEGSIIPAPSSGRSWKTTKEGMENLIKKKRIVKYGQAFGYKLYLDDYPISELHNTWNDTVNSFLKREYVVQTNPLVIQRCMMMTTEPGDLVFDPTCGSGTTAFVAEDFGRRWITCDTSRISLTIAKKRLMTSNFNYYQLAHPSEGIGSGLKYNTAPHVTLGSVANNLPEPVEYLFDKPLTDNNKQRVTGPFTIEAVPAPVARSFDDIENEQVFDADNSVARSGETLRQDDWRNELKHSGVRAKGGKLIEFTRVEPLTGTRFLQAEAETKEDNPKRVVVCFGSEHAPLEQRTVELALEEARTLKPKPEIILFCAFHFDSEARKDIEETNWPGITLLEAQMNADLLTNDLKKKRSSNESFWLIGQPDVEMKEIKTGDDKGKFIVEVNGFDYYNPKTGTVDSGGKGDIAMWMLDHDYDGRSLFPSQVFFPMAGAKEGWSTLAKNLKAEIDKNKIELFGGTVSLPFKPGREIAVKIIDARGIESLKIIRL